MSGEEGRTDRLVSDPNISRALWRFSLPMIASGVLQQVYSVTDAIILGNFVTGSAVGSVSAAQTVINVGFFVIIGLMTGFSIQLSHLFGAGEHDKIRRLSSTAVAILTAISVICSAIVMLGGSLFFAFMDTPSEITPMAQSYLSVAAVGLTFTMLYNLYSSMFRSAGDSRSPLIALIIATVVNIVLDLLFVAVFNWSVSGAAAATVIAQAISFFYMFAKIGRKMSFFKLSFKVSMFDMAQFYECVRLSVPRMLQSLAMTLGGVFLQRVTNHFGVDAVNAIATVYRVDSFAILPILYLNNALSIFTGQNIGAGAHDRVREGIVQGRKITLALSIGVAAILVLGGGVILSGFGISQGSIEIGRRFFYLCALFYPIMGVYNVYMGVLQGAKDVRYVAFINISALVVRLTCSYALMDIIGVDVIAVAECVSWTYGLALSYMRYRKTAL